MSIDKELIDKLLKHYQKPEDNHGENGLLKQLTKPVVERAMEAELTHHLGYAKHERSERGRENKRNGASRKKLQGECLCPPLLHRDTEFRVKIPIETRSALVSSPRWRYDIGLTAND